MARQLNPRQLTGREETHLVELPSGHRLQAAAATAFTALQRDARAAGFDLAIASSFRSYSRQLAIWNGKAGGLRKVHDDAGHEVDINALAAPERLRAILRFSAIPGTSRHHWGTDLDVYDAAALVGSTHVSSAERDKLAGLEELDLVDVFRQHHDESELYSWWDYRDGNFHKRKGLRIDLILGSKSIQQRTTRVFIDRNARKGSQRSDHAPVVADLSLATA